MPRKPTVDAGPFTTDVGWPLTDSECRVLSNEAVALAAAGIASIIPFAGPIVAATIPAQAKEIREKNKGHGVDVVLTVVTVSLPTPTPIVVGWSIHSRNTDA